MNIQPTSPFNLVFFNAQSLPPHQMAAWQALVSSPSHDPSLPTTPLLYAFVETDHHDPPSPPLGWTLFHQPGPAPPGRNGKGGGGITLFYHSDCAVKPLPQQSHTIHPPLLPPWPALACLFLWWWISTATTPNGTARWQPNSPSPAPRQ